jgi:hypothetical protein
MKDASKKEPMPIGGKTTVWPLVVEDIKNRNVVGIMKYGTPLKTNNMRDALMDAYQEALDLCMYLKQVLIERDGG